MKGGLAGLFHHVDGGGVLDKVAVAEASPIDGALSAGQYLRPLVSQNIRLNVKTRFSSFPTLALGNHSGLLKNASLVGIFRGFGKPQIMFSLSGLQCLIERNNFSRGLSPISERYGERSRYIGEHGVGVSEFEKHPRTVRVDYGPSIKQGRFRAVLCGLHGVLGFNRLNPNGDEGAYAYQHQADGQADVDFVPAVFMYRDWRQFADCYGWILVVGLLYLSALFVGIGVWRIIYRLSWGCAYLTVGVVFDLLGGALWLWHAS